jgi:hypothetical protein
VHERGCVARPCRFRDVARDAGLVQCAADAAECAPSSPAVRIHDQEDVAEAQRRCIGSLGEREFERFHTVNRKAV